MAFDLAFNCRATAIFVTDPAYGVPFLSETYPHTYTAANGYSINAGSVFGNSGQLENSASGNDPRIAGDMYSASGDSADKRTLRVDLSSGSAPGAGSYAADLAMGGAGYGYTATFVLNDDATTRITGSGTTLAAGHFEDATGANIAATTTWTGTPATVTFASTTANLILGAVNYAAVAHFRLTKQEGGGPETPTRRLSVRGA